MFRESFCWFSQKWFTSAIYLYIFLFVADCKGPASVSGVWPRWSRVLSSSQSSAATA